MESNIDLANEYFKDHKIITHEIFGTDLGRLEYMRWQKPGTWINGVDYLSRNGSLIVTGDLGDAIYCWHGNNLSLEWIAGLNLGYFHGKCQASELGRSTTNYEWDEEKATKVLFEEFKERRDCKGFKQFKDACLDIHSMESFHAWLHENSSEADKLFGPDWWEWVPVCGQVIPVRTMLHLFGLKMALGVEIK